MKEKLKQAIVDSATLKELMESSRRLASDPKARAKAEAEQRAKLKDGESFYIDELGIGHFFSANIHVSKIPTPPKKRKAEWE